MAPSKEQRGLSNVTRQAEKAKRREKFLSDGRYRGLIPNRWWFASTVLPLFAATFGPIASAFSICAMAMRWRVLIPSETSGGDGVYISDPIWLTAINAAQLIGALISNVFLSLNMARRIRFSIAQPVTIVGWYLSSFALAALIATMAGPLKVLAPAGQVHSQAFYYAIFSAGIYFIVASLMVITLSGAYMGRYNHESNVTVSQCTMMLQTISFLIYLLSGAVVYAHIEGWEYLDAVYWADCTLLTVGLGDYSPATTLGRGLLFPFAIGGVIILGLLINSIRSLVLERSKVKMAARVVEKERERVLKKLQRSNEILTPIMEKTSNSISDPVPTRSRVGTLTEGERRKLEFELMRKVQKHAAFREEWVLLLVSASTFFGLWFAAAAIFQVAERSQGWSYFDALYFSYTSLLTIGYGDFYPSSNLGKPFFVFWSLLAVPALTILISNMADTVITSVRHLTFFVGSFTVLPSDKSVSVAIKKALYKIPVRNNISDIDRQTPVCNRGDALCQQKDSTSNANANRRNDSDLGAEQAACNQKPMTDRRYSEELYTQGDNANLIDLKSRPYMLVKEIRNLLNHKAAGGSRNYTYNEWAWYLRLIGENESSPTTHRRARRGSLTMDNRGPPGGATLREITTNVADPQWSWIGYRSPLMGNRETEWLLERLTATLERELEATIENSEDNPL